jgi:asparagine N-glycosylation enzyme membrane subunit Stt3
MQRTLYLILTVCLVLLILTSLGIWIYSKDLFFLGIGFLMALALLLVVLELKKSNSDPFS